MIRPTSYRATAAVQWRSHHLKERGLSDEATWTIILWQPSSLHSLLFLRQSPFISHMGSDMATNDASRQCTELKTPKGTRDWAGQELLLRDYILYVQ